MPSLELPPELVNGIDLTAVAQPIDGAPAGKHLLSAAQFGPDDIDAYIDQAYAMEAALRDPGRGGIPLLPYAVLAAVMRQPSTRTAISMAAAMKKLGGFGEIISGMGGSAEAKDESLPDSWIAFAAQVEVLGARTYENHGPAFAAYVIDQAVKRGHLEKPVPVINLGDGTNEHPTQALGDLFTIHKEFRGFEGLTATVVGDHERYRAHHSFMLAAATAGMTLRAVEIPEAPMPPNLVEQLDRLERLELRTVNLDEALPGTDVLYLGRNPGEYTTDDPAEAVRASWLDGAYQAWIVDDARLQTMSPDSIVLHPRPRNNELDVSADSNHRMRDIEQMVNLLPMRMGIIALHSGVSAL